MSNNHNLNNIFPEVNNNLDENAKMELLKKELAQRFKDYNKTLTYLAGDAPISILCLPKATEKILLNSGCLRVYDLFNLDFTEIKGLGRVRIRDLTTRLDQFVAMF